MRQWFVGSCVAPSANRQVPTPPQRDIAYFEGVQDATSGVSYGYPALLSNNQFAEIQSRILQWNVSLSWHVEGTILGDTFDEIGAWSADTIPIVGFTERTLFQAFPMIGVLNGFGLPGDTYFFTRTTNGTPATLSGTIQGALQIMASGRNGFPADPVVPYVYRTDLDRWLPRVQFNNSNDNGFLQLVDTAYDESLPPDTHRETFTGSFNGSPMECHCVLADGLSLTSANLTIDPILWWEYRKADGTNPIYDSGSGAILPGRTPITQVF